MKTPLDLAKETIHAIENHSTIEISSYRMRELAREVVRLTEENAAKTNSGIALEAAVGEITILRTQLANVEKAYERLKGYVEVHNAAGGGAWSVLREAEALRKGEG